MTTSTAPGELPSEEIQQCILFIRGEKVMLDKHLAILYGVETRVLIKRPIGFRAWED